MSRSKKIQGLVMLTNEQMVNEYFRRIGEKDVNGLLELFSEDAIVYEPFSNLNGLQGKSLIGHFLKVAVMANSGMHRTIQFIDNTADSITAIIAFERGDTIKGRFAFTFVTTDEAASRKIKILRIQFI
jgi:hypothetical protein